MKAVYLALGLMMAGHACAASITGSIGVKLTIYSQCHIDGQSTTPATLTLSKLRPAAIGPAQSD